MNNRQLRNEIIKDTGQCVRCAACLPSCPTFTITQNESESPRGRIALAKNLAEQKIPQTEKLEMFLDHCVNCLACEPVCPSQVDYRHIISNTKILLNQKRKISLKHSVFHYLIIAPSFIFLGGFLFKFYKKIGLQKLLRKTKILKLLRLESYDNYLEKIEPFRLKTFYPATQNKKGRIALFKGCIQQMLDTETLTASIKLLTHCGYDVDIPKAQSCCGALDFHSGRINQALNFIHKNLQVFRKDSYEAVISCASGCGAMLNDYQPILVDFASESSFGNPSQFYDINYFLSQIDWPSATNFKALPKNVLIHTPCTLKNTLNHGEYPVKLLQQIPEIRLSALNYPHCCGASGEYMVRHAEMASRLAKPIVEEIIKSKADILVTSNIGCRLHLNSELKKLNFNIEIVHPVTLMARQLL